MRINFPHPIKRIGKCIASIQRNGLPWLEETYVRLNYEGEQWGGHRLSFCLNIHPIPRSCQTSDRVWTSEMVLHKCNHKWCINPTHLYLGGHSSNSKDFQSVITDEQRIARMAGIQRMRADGTLAAIVSKSRLGKKNTAEHNRRIGEAKRGKKMSDEARQRMSVAAKLRTSRVPKEEMRLRMQIVSRRGR